MTIQDELLNILVCPKCKGTLTLVTQPEGFGCIECKLLYKNEDDIPNFLVEEATPWETD